VIVNSTTWTDAPAGFSGSGSVGMSPFACPSAVAGTGVVMAPPAAPLRGIDLPVAVRLRAADERGAVRESSLQSAAVIGIAPLSATTQNIGTTLGIHPPGRPQS
jgi:hypothetical protein